MKETLLSGLIAMTTIWVLIILVMKIIIGRASGICTLEESEEEEDSSRRNKENVLTQKN